MKLTHGLSLTIALVASPCLTHAWMPQVPPVHGSPGYGYPVPGPVQPPWVQYPRYPSAPEAMPYPAWGAQPPTPGSPDAVRMEPAPNVEEPSPPGAGQTQPGAGRTYGAIAPGATRILREVTDDAYVVRILVGDGNTSAVQVSPRGNALVISRMTDQQNMQEDRFGDGRGYRRSFSYSRGSMSRRIGLPRDADLSRMTREEQAGTIVLRIPRETFGPGPWDGHDTTNDSPGAPMGMPMTPGH